MEVILDDDTTVVLVGLSVGSLEGQEVLVGRTSDGVLVYFVADLPSSTPFLTPSGWVVILNSVSVRTAYIAERSLITQPTVAEWILAYGYSVPVPQ